MTGTIEKPGITFRLMNDLYNQIQQEMHKKEIIIRMSYLEIYNELIKDLLTTDDKNLDLREDPFKGVVVHGITEVEVESTNQIMTLLKVGGRNRTKEATAVHLESSRSHGIILVHLEIKDRNQGIEEQINAAKLLLVDLAGSERAANTQNSGQRMVEGGKINQSLLVLGNCIQALSNVTEKEKKNVHVPYRGSKLTRLLKVTDCVAYSFLQTSFAL